MAVTTGLGASARSLVQRAILNYDEKYGYGSMSSAIYDTAWVSLITKPVDDGEKQWLFPQCFEYLLETQTGDGWDGGASQTDGILNTAASLLSLIRHSKEPLQITGVSPEELDTRISTATTSLQRQLHNWDVESSTHVGFEVIIPALLDLLEGEDRDRFLLQFSGREELMRLNAAKLSKFKPEYLYGKVQLTVLHSLEAFIGKIDFDKIAHHVVGGSLMASPSSTAAYLMNASHWDDDAEAYLRHVVSVKGNEGGVPSAYPSTYFEYSWLLSTLLKGGFTKLDLESAELTKITEILKDALRSQSGTIGFAPFLQPDVDDTATSLISLSLLGQSDEVDAEPMVRMFELETHFQTYALERNPSFTANCNALMALIHQPSQAVERYSPQILKTVRFLCDYWWRADVEIDDKWNICPLYPSMLITQAFTDILALIDNGTLPDLFDAELKGRVGITLFQACLRTLLSQGENGSWNNSIEQTSYGVLILAEARRLSFFEDIQGQLESAIHAAVDFIVSFDERPLDYLWIEKVTYRSTLLTDAYKLAALKASSFSRDSVGTNAIGFSVRGKVSSAKMAGYTKLVQSTPMFSKLPKWEIQASFLEANLFQPLLRARRLEIFPRKNMEEDKYFDMIPFIWALCNNYARAFSSTTFLFDMMVISFLNFQADEFMEGTAGPAFVDDLPRLRHLVDSAFTQHSNDLHNGNGSGPKSNENGNSNGHSSNGSAPASNGDGPVSEGNGNGTKEIDEADVSEPLQRFVRHVLNRADVASASAWDRKRLERELRIYLLSHTAQVEDNAKLARQEQTEIYHDTTDAFFDWVRTTSSDQTSGPYAFALVCCMMSSSPLCGSDGKGGKGSSSSNTECFPTVSQKYFAQALCRHLSTMCRMYNDYGSMERDAAEGNLSSLNFPEFGRLSPEGRKKELYKLAEYERACMDEALARLDREAGAASSLAARRAEKRKLAIWRVFIDVTDLHGQIYVVRDIASRIKAQQKQKQETETEKGTQKETTATAAPHTNGNGAVAATHNNGTNGVLSHSTNGN